MIYGFVGQIRQGKTLSVMPELVNYYNKGKTIYSNIKLNIPFKPLTLQMLIDAVEDNKDIFEPDSIVFIDEIHIWLDSRCSVSKRNKIVTYFLLQTGKMGLDSDYGLILIYTTQWIDQIDKRLRHLTEILIECQKFEFEGLKLFNNHITEFRGRDIIEYDRQFIGTKELYNMYNTKEIVRIEKTKYDEVIE